MQSTTTTQRLTSLGINLFFIVVTLAIVLPMALIVMVSLSSERSIIEHGYQFWPQQWSLEAYRYIFDAPGILLRAYGVTILVCVAGTFGGLMITSSIAYVISRRDYRYAGATTFYVFFTMLFSGGLVPFYILMTQYLHLKDSLLALIIPGLLSPFYVMVMKGFLMKIPHEIVESARIDGASEWRTYVSIILPLAKPALATIGLFISFGYWNEWFNAMLFIDNNRLVPLQLLLVRILNTIDFLAVNQEFVGSLGIDMTAFPSLSIRMAMAIVVAGPIMFVFPFFQRYFVKGLTVGALKG
ncbi:carbohydrate ABC transporter permease [Paenibacillus sp. 598K]|uniref:carbohydrate ABC transporter permease n=1 Tax=Paenibacillus sp. 598K TaxID=1117987 RepID=UPI000FF957CC|nr:carbohydrate ABC transporter permease [Paenibacillus sp. 598K]GBF71898.1 carbohydrate ABC transporter permease [Paenibacillus sp. 598K]